MPPITKIAKNVLIGVLGCGDITADRGDEGSRIRSRALQSLAAIHSWFLVAEAAHHLTVALPRLLSSRGDDDTDDTGSTESHSEKGPKISNTVLASALMTLLLGDLFP